MNLGKSIYNLLKRQPEVYVKGLGTFKRNHTSATYDEKRNVYLPPISYIDFDRSSDKGYDFIQYTQQLHVVDRAEAERMVESAVVLLIEAIQNEGQAKLDDLGYLVSYGDSYVFKALDLSGFDYQPVEALLNQPLIVSQDQTPVEPIAVTPEPEEIVEEPTAMPEAEQPIAAEVILPEVETEEYREEERKSSNAIWYVVAAVVALGIIAVLYFSYQNTGTKPKETLPVQIANSHDTTEQVLSPNDSIVPSDTSRTLPVDTLVNDVEEKTALIPEHHYWQIVIGSHKTLAQAYEQAEAYHKAGYPRVKVIPSNLAKNRKKVIWDSYATKAEVDSALKYVQKHIIKDAWPDKIK